MANTERCFSDTMFDGLGCSGIKGGFALNADAQYLDEGRGYLSPMDLYSCDLDGFDLFGAPGIADF
jgi:hypothetical protein